MKIGIMGGTFDPIHKGHLMIATEAKKQFNLDKIWFLPNGHPPHKEYHKISSSVKDRLKMVELAIDEIENFELNTYETDKESTSYSYSTLEYFRSIYQDSQFYFILGADSLLSLESWKYPQRVLDSCVILAAYRDEMDTKEEMEEQIIHLKEKFNGDIRLIDSPVLPISSHQIREGLLSGDKQDEMKEMLPLKVFQYIKENHLYENF
ncbi:MAG TPA: nicotinate-nucleotide adenylyltransferase [Candidatus Dorea intestinavium]|nr:nicotinate-nucleotide adenylyltransferase [Candidatus Dorea intestinavium]